ncbi:MAG: hypothetical protein JNK02_10125 [Planctomycetes bacterium]|nr:hypothetical protein [Planctomycetota bacterium]
MPRATANRLATPQAVDDQAGEALAARGLGVTSAEEHCAPPLWRSVRAQDEPGGANVAGYSKIYVIGGQGGVMGADGVNPIELLILVGDASRQWLEPHYFDKSIQPIGKLRVIIPAGPDQPDSLLDACIAFCPRHFSACPSLQEVESALRAAERLDFHARPGDIPAAWARLRDEARPLFAALSLWQADLVPIDRR